MNLNILINKDMKTRIEIIQEQLKTSSHPYKFEETKNEVLNYYKDNLDRLQETKQSTFNNYNFLNEVLQKCEKKEKESKIEKIFERVVKLERHAYSSEQNKLHFTNRQINVSGQKDITSAISYILTKLSVKQLDEIIEIEPIHEQIDLTRAKFVIIHTFDSLNPLNSVISNRKLMKKFKPLVETECYKGMEREYSSLFEESEETNLVHHNKIYHLKFYGVLNFEEMEKYIEEFSYLENEGCQTMGCLTEFGHLSDISLSYFDYTDNTKEDVRIAPLVETEKEYEEVINWIEEKFK